MVKTDIANGTISRVALAFKSLLSISAHHGCQTIIYCAVDNEVVNESGHFYANFTKYVNQRCAVRNYIAEFACDDQSAQMLWNLSCELVKLEDKFNIPPPDDTVIVN